MASTVIECHLASCLSAIMCVSWHMGRQAVGRLTPWWDPSSWMSSQGHSRRHSRVLSQRLLLSSFGERKKGLDVFLKSFLVVWSTRKHNIYFVLLPSFLLPCDAQADLWEACRKSHSGSVSDGGVQQWGVWPAGQGWAQQCSWPETGCHHLLLRCQPGPLPHIWVSRARAKIQQFMWAFVWLVYILEEQYTRRLFIKILRPVYQSSSSPFIKKRACIPLGPHGITSCPPLVFQTLFSSWSHRQEFCSWPRFWM